MPGKGHSIAGEEVAVSSEIFGRMDLAYSQLLYEPSFDDANSLKKLVKDVNKLKLGKSYESLEKILADEKEDAATKKAAEAIKKLIDRRVDAIFSTMKELAQKDALLCDYYSKPYGEQLKDHPREKEFEQLLKDSPALKNLKAAKNAFKSFSREAGGLVGGGGKLNKSAINALKSIVEDAGADSLLGRQAADLLKLQ
jgi:hypothetical protein